MGDLAPAQLSERERQVAERYVDGQSYKEIARSLGISPATVRTHANAVYRKLEVTSRIELLHRLQPPAPKESPGSVSLLQGTERRLLAILCADVVGYSTMIERDEAGTIAALRVARDTIITPVVTEHRGRIAQIRGDGLLALFESVVDAVACGAAIQQAMLGQEGIPEPVRIVWRIGVNLGDVAVVDGEIFGDGVNVAARLEALCEPGGLLVSGTAYDHLHGRIELDFEAMGERQVKNIERPVRVYRLEAGARSTPPGPTPPLPDQPSLAVLPFDNLSGDPEQEYFSDGITEDLITDLSKVEGLFVLARNSSFAVRGKPREVRELGGRLGVRHVIEGSVRRAGQRVRITAQLIDAVTGGHLWAERYDRDLTDIFAVQDEITAEIVRALKIRLLPAAKPARLGDAARSVEAYELVLRGRHLLRTDGTRRAQARARSLFLAAAELDAGSAEAFAGIAEAECYLHIYHGAAVAPEAIRANCDRALMLDPTLAAAHASRGEAHVCAGDLDEAERDLRHAIGLDPDLYQAQLFQGRLCILTGRLEEASRHFSRAAACRPTDAHALMMLMMCRRDLGDGRGLAAAARTGLDRARAEVERRPDNATAMFQCAVAHAMLAEREEALAMARLALSCDRDDLIVQYNVACVRALAGDPDGAMDLLETLLPKASWHRREWLRRDMDFATLHAEPRFIALLQTHGISAPDASR